MKDILKYRIPDTKVIEKLGSFKKMSLENLPDGFVVCPFSGSVGYWFEESPLKIEEKIDLPRPNCYSKEDYLNKADSFIDSLIDQKLSKAVFSRVKKVNKSADVDIVFNRLCHAYPRAFVYLISCNDFGTWIGATPETLLTAEKGIGKSIALAGTLKSDDHSLWAEKEKMEQQYVTEFIFDCLETENVADIHTDGPKDFIAGPVKHLATHFQFSMAKNNALDIALKLHPTPAVSGFPRKEALALIDRVESHDRNLYAGFLGVLGETSNLFVNLRCAQVIEDDWYLYLGGGFTIDSNSEKEWIETENKSRTILDILEKE